MEKNFEYLRNIRVRGPEKTTSSIFCFLSYRIPIIRCISLPRPHFKFSVETGASEL